MGSSLKHHANLPREVGEGQGKRRGERAGVREGRAGWEEGWGISQDDSSFKLAPFPPTARLHLTFTAFMVFHVIDQLKQLACRPDEQSMSRKYMLGGAWGEGLMVSWFTNWHTWRLWFTEYVNVEKTQERQEQMDNGHRHNNSRKTLVFL